MNWGTTMALAMASMTRGDRAGQAPAWRQRQQALLENIPRRAASLVGHFGSGQLVSQRVRQIAREVGVDPERCRWAIGTGFSDVEDTASLIVWLRGDDDLVERERLWHALADAMRSHAPELVEAWPVVCTDVVLWAEDGTPDECWDRYEELTRRDHPWCANPRIWVRGDAFTWGLVDR